MSAPLFIGASVASTLGNINPDIQLTGALVLDVGAGAEAGISLQDDGDLLHLRQVGSIDTITDEWILDSEKVAGVLDDYEVRCNVVSGILDSGISDTTGAWLDGAAQGSYSWSVSVNAGTGLAEVTVLIRDKATETVQAQANFELEANT